MLEGITVLNQVTETRSWWWLLAIIPVVLFGIILLWWLIGYCIKCFKGKEYFDLSFTAIFIPIIALCIIVPYFSILDIAKQEKTTTYKVLISEEVNFNEFNAKYEIMEQEGKIYTIKRREESEGIND